MIDTYRNWQTHLSPFILSMIVEISCPDGVYTPKIVSKDIFPHLKLLILNRELTTSYVHRMHVRRTSMASQRFEARSCSFRSMFQLVLQQHEQLDAAKAGDYDAMLIEMVIVGNSSGAYHIPLDRTSKHQKLWLGYIDEFCPRSFTVHSQNVVEFIFAGSAKVSETPVPLDAGVSSTHKLVQESLQRFLMVLYWDYDRRTVLERHFSEGLHVSNQGVEEYFGEFKCLTEGYCTSCHDETVSDRQNWNTSINAILREPELRLQRN